MKWYATVLRGSRFAGCLLAVVLAMSANAAQDAGEKQFLNSAAKGSTAEVALGQMAETRAEDEDVQAFGRRMVQDHRKALEEARQLASETGVPLSVELTPENEKLAEDLSGKIGAEFDRVYMQAMVKNHKQTVDRFEKQAQSGNGKVAAYAEKQLPVLKEHLEMAQNLSGELQQSD